jgi:hypothetical protein
MKRAYVTIALAEFGARFTWNHMPEKALNSVRAVCRILLAMGPTKSLNELSCSKLRGTTALFLERLKSGVFVGRDT